MKGWFQRPLDGVFVGMTLAERLAAGVVLVAIGLVVLPFALDAREAGRELLYCAFLAYLGALALPFVWPRFRPGIFHPIVFYVIWVGIRGLMEGKAALAASGLEYHRALSGTIGGALNGLAAEAFLLEAVALLSLYAGYALVPHFRAPVMNLPRISAPALKTAAWVGISGLGLLMLVHVGGSLVTVLMQRGMPGDERIAAQVGGHWNFLAGIGPVAALIWLACDARAVRRPVFWFLLLIALAIKFAATGSRGGTVTPLIMVGAIWMLHHRTVPYRFIVLGVVLVLLVVGGLGQYRSATQQASSFSQVNVKGDVSDWMANTVEELQSGSGENSGYIAVLGKVPEDVPYLWGESYLSLPFIFVPGALWGEKPDAAGRLNAIRVYERPLTSIPPGSVGEAYWNFSYAGVVLVFLVYGGVLKLVAAFYRANPSHPLVMVAFIYVLFYMAPHSPSLYGFFHATIPALIVLGTFAFPPGGRLLRPRHLRHAMVRS